MYDGYYYRCFEKFYLNDYRGAIQDYDKVIELRPDFSYVYIRRGICKYNLGLLDSACLDLLKAVELRSKK